MAERSIVILCDVDNTLFDNDGFIADFQNELRSEVGAEKAQSYWAAFEQLRSELGYADYLGALQRYRRENPHDPTLLSVSHYLIQYPFAQRLYPQVPEVIQRLATIGLPVILSDGDVIFQPLKVQNSGLSRAFEDRVLIYVHKETELVAVEQRFPADHYVMIDDKLYLLSAIKKIWGSRVTTVFVRQGHYALDPLIVGRYEAADVTLERISDLVTCDSSVLTRTAKSSPVSTSPVPEASATRTGISARPDKGGPLLLVLNAGSSSLKFALFTSEASPERVFSGSIDRIGTPEAGFTIKEPGAKKRVEVSAGDHTAGLEHLLAETAKRLGARAFVAAGHRIVHGGPKYREPQMVDDDMLTELRRIRPFDPEHLPAEIAIMEALASKFPGLPQVACFDTAFHQSLPQVARLLPIPRRYQAQGIERYGFHGISYSFLMEELARLGGDTAALGRVVLAHLGNGASITALKGGLSMDTSMAFTPTAGLPMSTRSGDLDPGIAAYLAYTEGMTTDQFFNMANHESGLLGLSETSSDMRDLSARESQDTRAAEAIGLFCYQASKWIGGYVAVLGGLDTLVFSGGIGENAAPIRARICESLRVFGLRLDPGRNAANAEVISSDDSKVVARVIRTDEELMIARSMCRVFEARKIQL